MLKKNNLYLFLLCASLAAYGCGTSGTSTTETLNSNDQQTSTVLNGVTLTNSMQGQSVGLADVDGDEIADKLVGAPYAAVSSQTGAVIVYKGSSSGFSAEPASLLTGDVNFGSSVFKLEKGSSDTSEKFAVGAINGDGTDVSLCGSVAIYQAGSTGPKLLVKLSGEGPMDKFGYSLASGDFNGDGKTDIAIGAPYHNPAPSLYRQGAVYVYLGPDFGTKIALRASSANKGLARALATGDINGDGIADLLISANGKVLGFYGGTSFAPAIGFPDVTISSSASGFGKSIAVIGDIDADGYGEIAIGAPNAVITFNGVANRDTGSVYIIKGGSGIRSISNADTSTDKIVRIDGNALFDRFGSSIVPVGDVDGGSKPDFAVGATMADVNAGDISGKVYLLKGENINATTITLTLANATAFNGTIKDQAYGTFLVSSGNGKLLIGAPNSNMNTGGVSMVDLATGQVVSDGGSGGSGGGGDGHDHAPIYETDTD